MLRKRNKGLSLADRPVRLFGTDRSLCPPTKRRIAALRDGAGRRDIPPTSMFVPRLTNSLALMLLRFLGRRAASHFVSWLALCPDNDIGGGRVLWRGVRKANNRAGEIFRMAAQSLHRSPTPLGNYLRRLKGRFGPAVATTATANANNGCNVNLPARPVASDTNWFQSAFPPERQTPENKRF